MTAPELPREVLALVHGPVNSIGHVELLLALRTAAPESRPLAALAATANLATPAEAQLRLHGLETAGLVERVGEDGWRYAPADATARRDVDRLAAMYNEKPVTLVRALYEQPAKPLQSFANAFRLRVED